VGESAVGGLRSGTSYVQCSGGCGCRQRRSCSHQRSRNDAGEGAARTIWTFRLTLAPDNGKKWPRTNKRKEISL